jgi:hypothetical protein
VSGVCLHAATQDDEADLGQRVVAEGRPQDAVAQAEAAAAAAAAEAAEAAQVAAAAMQEAERLRAALAAAKANNVAVSYESPRQPLELEPTTLELDEEPESVHLHVSASTEDGAEEGKEWREEMPDALLSGLVVSRLETIPEDAGRIEEHGDEQTVLTTWSVSSLASSSTVPSEPISASAVAKAQAAAAAAVERRVRERVNDRILPTLLASGGGSDGEEGAVAGVGRRGGGGGGSGRSAALPPHAQDSSSSPPSSSVGAELTYDAVSSVGYAFDSDNDSGLDFVPGVTGVPKVAQGGGAMSDIGLSEAGGSVGAVNSVMREPNAVPLEGGSGSDPAIEDAVEGSSGGVLAHSGDVSFEGMSAPPSSLGSTLPPSYLSTTQHEAVAATLHSSAAAAVGTAASSGGTMDPSLLVLEVEPRMLSHTAAEAAAAARAAVQAEAEAEEAGQAQARAEAEADAEAEATMAAMRSVLLKRQTEAERAEAREAAKAKYREQAAAAAALREATRAREFEVAVARRVDQVEMHRVKTPFSGCTWRGAKSTAYFCSPSALWRVVGVRRCCCMLVPSHVKLFMRASVAISRRFRLHDSPQQHSVRMTRAASE